jgi:hypothetical protein
MNTNDLQKAVLDPSEPVEVYTVTSAETAELIRAILEADGIHCWIEGESQAGLTGILPIGLYVQNKDVDRAFRVIETFDH